MIDENRRAEEHLQRRAVHYKMSVAEYVTKDPDSVYRPTDGLQLGPKDTLALLLTFAGMFVVIIFLGDILTDWLSHILSFAGHRVASIAVPLSLGMSTIFGSLFCFWFRTKFHLTYALVILAVSFIGAYSQAEEIQKKITWMSVATLVGFAIGATEAWQIFAEKMKPRQAPEPVPTAVTSSARQEPRQP